MNSYQIRITAKAYAFVGLAKQNINFHQAICELVDNAIAATKPMQKAIIYISMAYDPMDHNYIHICVADWGIGMDVRNIESALQLGSIPVSDNRLNEHGFGLNNALAALAGENGAWQLTSHKGAGNYYYIQGPFAENMVVEESDKLLLRANISIMQPELPSTAICARVPLAFVQTLRRGGGKCSDLVTLRGWLVEHLGVSYRGYLDLDPATMEPSAKIIVGIGKDKVLVPTIPVPMTGEKTKRFDLELGGAVVPVEYKFGLLDEDKRNHLVYNAKTKYYYQGNIPTQGIDIRLGKRVIATAQLDQIWRVENGGNALIRHNNYNLFLGELLLPELPRGVLSTLNNKTGINPVDSEWQKVFDKLNEFKPPAKIRAETEAAIKVKWMEILRAACTTDTVSDEIAVWPTATRIDIVQQQDTTKGIKIYELKAGKAEPLNLYQLKMYWDGLVLSGKQPEEGTLLVQDYNTDIVQMAAMMNQMMPPNLPCGTASAPYHFTLARHAEKCLA